MDQKDIPDRRKRRVPRKVTVSISNVAGDDSDFLKNQGKNVSEYLRPTVEKLLAVAAAAMRKKTG